MRPSNQAIKEKINKIIDNVVGKSDSKYGGNELFYIAQYWTGKSMKKKPFSVLLEKALLKNSVSNMA